MLRLITLILTASLAVATPGKADQPAGEVFKSDSCECCHKWMQHMTQSGFSLKGKDIQSSERTRLRAHLGIKPEHAACHTAIIEGYVVEGHVPAADVKRLLAEKPDAVGLTVPEMPIGSPGMEADDGTVEPYKVLLMKKDGTTEVFAEHGGKN